MKQLIGVSGFARSGKDTVCEILLHHGVIDTRYAFADPIKVVTNALFDWDDRHGYGDLKEVTVDAKIDTAGIVDALIAIQQYGLDEFGMPGLMIILHLREMLKVTPIPLFAKLCEKVGLGEAYEYLNGCPYNRYRVSPREVYQKFGTDVCRVMLDDSIWVLIAPRENVCIPDVRFPNEATWVGNNGGLMVRVRGAAESTPVRPHESEAWINALPYDILITNTGTLEELETQVMQAFEVPETSTRLY